MDGFELITFVGLLDFGNLWNYLVPSLGLFWPDSHATLVFKDTPESHQFASTLPKTYRIPGGA